LDSRNIIFASRYAKPELAGDAKPKRPRGIWLCRIAHGIGPTNRGNPDQSLKLCYIYKFRFYFETWKSSQGSAQVAPATP
jgi:hypothetical protein